MDTLVPAPIRGARAPQTRPPPPPPTLPTTTAVFLQRHRPQRRREQALPLTTKDGLDDSARAPASLEFGEHRHATVARDNPCLWDAVPTGCVVAALYVHVRP